MNNASNTFSRIIWVDWAKAILIILVCVGHMSPPEEQRLLIWGFHMPAFFFVSGYLYRRHDAWKTIISFVVPVFFYSLITYVIHIVKDLILQGYWDYQLDFSHPWYRMIGQFFIRIHENPYGDIPVMGLWFIIALMACRLLCGDLKFFSFVLRYRYIVLLVLLLWLTVEPLAWEYIQIKDLKLYYGVYAMPFFLSGYIGKNIGVDFRNIKLRWVLLATASYCIVCLSLPRFDMLNYQCGPFYPLFFFNSLCGTLVLIWFCIRLPRNRIVEVFSIGTLFILMLHMQMDYFILPIFHRVGITPNSTYLGQSLVPWIETTVVLMISYYPIKWLSCHCSILLGKIRHKSKV